MIESSPFFKTAQVFLKKHHQSQLLDEIKSFDQDALELFWKNLSKLEKFLKEPLPEVEHKAIYDINSLSPYNKGKYHYEKYYQKGLEAVKRGLVASLILAGGVGSRLNHTRPKGCFPVSPILKKTLFQYQMEKVACLNTFSNQRLPVIILTSEKNAQSTLEYFSDNNFFGMEDQIQFITQPSIPFFDDNNNWFFSKPGKIASGPDGNGSFISTILCSEFYSDLKKAGVEHLLVTAIDNPIADPFDLELIGKHLESNSDISLRGYKRDDEKEKVGILAYQDEKLVIVDYNNFDHDQYIKKNKDDQFFFPIGNTNIFCFSLDFLETIHTTTKLPFHWVQRHTEFYDPKTQETFQVDCWKGEKFMTDLLRYSDKINILITDKSDCFGPLKTAKGENSIEFVQKAIFEKNRRLYEKYTGMQTDANFELSLDYYYPDPQFGKILKNKPPLEGQYITP